MFRDFLARKSRENLDTLTGEIGGGLSALTLGLVSAGTEKKMYWWGVPSLGLMGVSDFLTLFLLYYYNQILGLSAVLAGLALFVCVVFDAVSDPVIAHWSDRHKGEFGRRIPFMFVGIAPMVLSCLALFVIHPGEEQWILFVQLTVLMSVFQVANTIFAVPRLALGVELYKDYSKRNQLLGTDRIFEIAGGALCLGPILLLMPDWDQAHLYPWAALWTCVLLGWSLYLGTVRLSAVERNLLELDRTGKTTDFSLSTLLGEVRSLLANRNWMTLLIAFLFFGVNSGIQTSDQVYLNNHLFRFDPRDLFWAIPLQLGGGAIAALRDLAYRKREEQAQPRPDRKRPELRCFPTADRADGDGLLLWLRPDAGRRRRRAEPPVVDLGVPRWAQWRYLDVFHDTGRFDVR